MEEVISVLHHIIYTVSLSGTIMGRGYSHTWVLQGGSTVMTIVFEIFDPIWSIFYDPSRSDLYNKIGLSLSQSVPKILAPKVGLIVHQNVLFNSF